MKKLVWLSTEKEFGREARGVLRENRWQVIETSDVAVLEREVQAGGVCLAVVAGGLISPCLEGLAAFRAQYREFPTVFHRSSAFCWVEDKTSPWLLKADEAVAADFVAMVEKFAVYAAAEQERRQASILLEKLEALGDSFDIRDMNMALIGVLNFFQTEFQCENVFWFQQDELKKAAEQNDRRQPYKFVSLEDMRHSSCPMMASRPFDLRETGQMLKDFCHGLPQGWAESDRMVEAETGFGRVLLVPLKNMYDESVIGHFLLLNGVSVGETWLSRAVLSAQKFVGRQMTYCRQFAAVKSLSYVDHLTDLFNQRFLPIVLDREISRVERYGSRFAVLFLDIDHFKAINDSHGHLIGSGIITQLGDVLRGCIRESDYGFRFGGDEFVLVLVESGVEEAEAVAERIRKTVEKRVFKVNHGEYRITVSIGVASCPRHAKTKEEILAMADEAMYYGKNTTKNVVYVAS